MNNQPVLANKSIHLTHGSSPQQKTVSVIQALNIQQTNKLKHIYSGVSLNTSINPLKPSSSAKISASLSNSFLKKSNTLTAFSNQQSNSTSANSKSLIKIMNPISFTESPLQSQADGNQIRIQLQKIPLFKNRKSFHPHVLVPEESPIHQINANQQMTSTDFKNNVERTSSEFDKEQLAEKETEIMNAQSHKEKEGILFNKEENTIQKFQYQNATTPQQLKRFLIGSNSKPVSFSPAKAKKPNSTHYNPGSIITTKSTIASQTSGTLTMSPTSSALILSSSSPNKYQQDLQPPPLQQTQSLVLSPTKKIIRNSRSIEFISQNQINNNNAPKYKINGIFSQKSSDQSYWSLPFSTPYISLNKEKQFSPFVPTHSISSKAEMQSTNTFSKELPWMKSSEKSPSEQNNIINELIEMLIQQTQINRVAMTEIQRIVELDSAEKQTADNRQDTRKQLEVIQEMQFHLRQQYPDISRYIEFQANKTDETQKNNMKILKGKQALIQQYRPIATNDSCDEFKTVLKNHLLMKRSSTSSSYSPKKILLLPNENKGNDQFDAQVNNSSFSAAIESQFSSAQYINSQNSFKRDTLQNLTEESNTYREEIKPQSNSTLPDSNMLHPSIQDQLSIIKDRVVKLLNKKKDDFQKQQVSNNIIVSKQPSE